MRPVGATLWTLWTGVLSTSPHGDATSRLPLFLPHLTDEKTEAQRGLIQAHTSWKDFRASQPYSRPLSSGCQALAVGWEAPRAGPRALGSWGTLGPQRAAPSLLVPRWQRKVPTCLPAPAAGAEPRHPWGMPLHSCGGGVAAHGSVCPRPCPLLSRTQLQALSQLAGQPRHSQKITRTGLWWPEGRRKFYFPSKEGGGGLSVHIWGHGPDIVGGVGVEV